LPQYPNEHHDFWNIWVNVIRNNTAKDLDVIFSSEPYGKILAEKMRIDYFDVDIDRKTVPICATLIR
jgi:nicotinamide mononucleotide adenylyltransferase